MENWPNSIVFNSFVELLTALCSLLGALILIIVGAFFYGRHTQQKWQAAMMKMPIGVAIYNLRGRLIYANSLADHLLQNLDSSVKERAKQIIKQREQLTWTVHAPGNILVQAQTRLLPGSSAPMLLTLQDFSHMQRQESGYRDFVQALSHELQTPLTAIQGHLAHIASSMDDEDYAWKGSLRVAQDEIERLAWLTPNVLTLLRLDSGQALNRRLNHLGVIAEEVVQQLWDRAAQRQITLSVNLDPDLDRILVDRNAWKQVFLNLIDNGIKYGRDNGSVIISLRQTETVQMITIVDDGPGIHPDDIPHLFTQFYRSEHHQHIRGSGLGLAIAKRIVNLHGGEIICRSNNEVSSGTEFQITLPLEKANVTET